MNPYSDIEDGDAQQSLLAMAPNISAFLLSRGISTFVGCASAVGGRFRPPERSRGRWLLLLAALTRTRIPLFCSHCRLRFHTG